MSIRMRYRCASVERDKMIFRLEEKNGRTCAVVESPTCVITDAQTALDVLMNAKYEVGTKNIAIGKELIAEEFLQKYVNYGGRIAIYGDYSHYTSKPLRDFIYESNKGKDVFFVATEEEAIEKLTR